MDRYSELWEFLEILQTVTCYLNRRHYTGLYMKLIIDYLEPLYFVSTSVFRSKPNYHHITHILVLSETDYILPDIPKTIPVPYNIIKAMWPDFNEITEI